MGSQEVTEQTEHLVRSTKLLVTETLRQQQLLLAHPRKDRRGSGDQDATIPPSAVSCKGPSPSTLIHMSPRGDVMPTPCSAGFWDIWTDDVPAIQPNSSTMKTDGAATTLSE